MNILSYPNDKLRIKTVAVEKVTAELKQIALDMYKTMKEANGLGLASTQVGLDIRLLVLEDNNKPLIMFNPSILERSKECNISSEGCLSFPGDYHNIKRNNSVKVKYRDENNKMQYRELKGLMARAFQHEFDHLQSVLFIDYLEK